MSEQYGDTAAMVSEIPAKLAAIDIANQGTVADVASVGDALAAALALPRGSRPRRIVVDPQRKGVGDIEEVRSARQREFFAALGIDGLLKVRTFK